MNLSKSKVLSLLEACFDLISSPSPSIKIQIIGGKNTENLGLESLLRNWLFLFCENFIWGSPLYVRKYIYL